MNFKRLVISIVAGLLALSAPAFAQTAGFYVGGDAGYHWPDRIDTRVANTDEHWAWWPGGGADGFAVAGYGFGSGFRAEIEGGYRPGDLNAIQADIFLPLLKPALAPLIPAGGIRFSDVGGHVDAATLMANLLYDLPLGLPVQPFVGGGAGLVHTSVAAQGRFPFCPICFRPAICFPTCSIDLKLNDSSDRLGWQAIGGVSMALAPQWTLNATYRYLRADNVSWGTKVGGVPFANGRFSGNYSDSSVTLGVRYSFGGGPDQGG